MDGDIDLLMKASCVCTVVLLVESLRVGLERGAVGRRVGIVSGKSSKR